MKEIIVENKLDSYRYNMAVYYDKVLMAKEKTEEIYSGFQMHISVMVRQFSNEYIIKRN